ncbi:MAG: DUF975 family protein [Oribacterium sp.]|nr:DUF975 family protein [Oribacterium sp.]
MMTITQIKTFAKRQLRGNKLAAAGAMILVFICTMLWCSALFSVVFVGIIGPSTGRFVIPELARNERLQLLFYVGTGIIIASLLFLGIYLYSGLMLGSQKLYLNIAKGRRVSAFDVFRGFSDGEQLKHYFWVILIIYFIQFLIMVPETVIAIISGKGSSDYRITSTITTFITYIVALFLSMSCFASADHPEVGAWKAIGVSFHLMRKRKFKFMCLELSFLGWFVFVVITFGIAGFWIIPYFNTSLSIFYLSAYGQDYISTPKDVYVRGDAKPDSVKSDAVKPGVAEAVMASSSSEKSVDSGSMESESERAKTGRRSFEEVRSEFTDFGSDEADNSEESYEKDDKSADFSGDEGNASADFNLTEADTSTDLNEHETGDFIEINGNENIGFIDLDKAETNASAEINSDEGSGFVDLDKSKTSAFAERNDDNTKVSNDFSEVGTGTSDDDDTAESVTKVDSFLNAGENNIGMSFDADQNTSAEMSGCSTEVSSDEIKIDSVSGESAETLSDNGIKKNYDSEEDAYAAYVQWKKDHGITIDNPDPFHNIHHKDNGKESDPPHRRG